MKTYITSCLLLAISTSAYSSRGYGQYGSSSSSSRVYQPAQAAKSQYPFQSSMNIHEAYAKAREDMAVAAFKQANVTHTKVTQTPIGVKVKQFVEGIPSLVKDAEKVMGENGFKFDKKTLKDSAVRAFNTQNDKYEAEGINFVKNAIKNKREYNAKHGKKGIVSKLVDAKTAGAKLAKTAGAKNVQTLRKNLNAVYLNPAMKAAKKTAGNKHLGAIIGEGFKSVKGFIFQNTKKFDKKNVRGLVEMGREEAIKQVQDYPRINTFLAGVMPAFDKLVAEVGKVAKETKPRTQVEDDFM